MNAIVMATARGADEDKIFEPYEVISEPLPRREDRVFRRDNGATCYGAYSIKLARLKSSSGNGLYILMSNGSGNSVMAIRDFYDGGALRDFIINMPEREQYALLWTIWRQASEAAEFAADKTGAEWRQAFVDKRIRKTRAKQGRCRVFIEPKGVTEERAASEEAARHA